MKVTIICKFTAIPGDIPIYEWSIPIEAAGCTGVTIDGGTLGRITLLDGESLTLIRPLSFGFNEATTTI